MELIDAAEPGEGASHGNAGIISPWSCVPQSLPGLWKSMPGWVLNPYAPVSVSWRDLPATLPWAVEFLANARGDRLANTADTMDSLVQGNVDHYRRWLAGTGQESLVRDSWYVNVLRGWARANLDDAVWRLRIERGAPVELIDGCELRRLEPAIATQYHSAVIIKDQARAWAPGSLCKVLALKVAGLGVRFRRERIQVIEAGSRGQIALLAEGGQRHTVNRLVVCAGLASARLLAASGLRFPIISERGYHLEFADPGVELQHSIMDVAGKFVVSSMAGGVRTAGTAEFARAEAPPNLVRAHRFKDLTCRLLPDLNTGNVTPWMGVRPSFPDSLPAIGPIASMPGVYAAFGHSHYGLGMAPATGRIIASMLAGVPVNGDLTAMAPSRFGRAQSRQS